MTLREQVEINEKIMQLIYSKYRDSFPTGYNTPESRYYLNLQRDVLLALRYETVEKSRIPGSR